ncbi:hypothetical protein ALPO108162_17150 [Alicyclobacillus pomorum]
MIEQWDDRKHFYGTKYKITGGRYPATSPSLAMQERNHSLVLCTRLISIPTIRTPGSVGGVGPPVGWPLFPEARKPVLYFDVTELPQI